MFLMNLNNQNKTTMEAAVARLNSQEPQTHSLRSQPLSKQQEEFSEQFALLPVRAQEELYNSQCATLKQVDKTALAFCIASNIGGYLSFVGLEDKMNDAQIAETASMMIECQPNIPIDVLKLFFFNCKRGVYGKHYNRMDGSTLLQWFDQFCNEFFVQREEADYQKHLAYKQDIASPAKLTDEEGEPIDLTQLLASFHGKTKEQLERENKIKDIRYQVFKQNMHLYNEMSVEEADKIIEQAIIDEMKAHGLINF